MEDMGGSHYLGKLLPVVRNERGKSQKNSTKARN
jgi:hypothetical protein